MNHAFSCFDQIDVERYTDVPVNGLLIPALWSDIVMAAVVLWYGQEYGMAIERYK